MKCIWGILTITAGMLLAGCNGGVTADPTEAQQAKVGDTSTLAFSAKVETSITQGKQNFKLTISDPSSKTPMPGLMVTVKPTMPSMGMTAKGATATESEAGDGTYEVKDVNFSMSGDWFVEYHASMPDMADTVTFTYSVP